MTLPLPNLDQRDWADLVAEGLARAPRHAPAWTDQNAHDPGVTLIELLAYKAEQSLFRANRVTAALRRQFLALAGPSFLPAGPRAGRLDLAFRLTPGADAPADLPAGLLLVAADLAGPPAAPLTSDDPLPVPVRLTHRLVVQPITLRSVQTSDGRGLPRDVTHLRREGASFPAWGDDPADPATVDPPAAYPPALFLGLDRLPAPDSPLCLRVAIDRPGPPRDERSRLASALEERARSCKAPEARNAPRMIADPSTAPPGPGPETWDGLPVDVRSDPLPGGDTPPVSVAWEYWDQADGAGAWRALDADDPTRGLTLDGTVTLTIPAGATGAGVVGRQAFAAPSLSPRPVRLGAVPVAYHYLRCRLASGRPDVSPRVARVEVNTVEVEQVMPALSTRPKAEVGPRTDDGSAESVSLETLALRLLTALDGPGSSSGPVVAVQLGPEDEDRRLAGITVTVWSADPTVGVFPARLLDPGGAREDGSKVVALPGAPVVPGSLRLVSLEPMPPADPSPTVIRIGGPGRLTTWELRAWSPSPSGDFVGAGPSAAWFTLDPSTGEVTFGDGVNGRALPGGALVLAAYDVTRASQGNPPPRRRWSPAGAPSLAPDVFAAPLPYGLIPLAQWNAGLWRDRDKVKEAPQAVPYEATNLGPLAGDPARAGIEAEALDDALARLARSTRVHEDLADLAARNGGTLDGVAADDLLRQAVPRQAVTPADLERLALDTPGADVLRARAFAESDPDIPGLAAPGAVALVVLPGLPAGRPSPSPNLIRRVNAHLQPLRGLGTRLKVIGPVYAGRSVSAGLRIGPGYDPPSVVKDAERSLRDWLDPLGVGGGPPPRFGRDVLRNEVLARLAGVEGVVEVVGLTVSPTPDAPTDWTPWTLPAWGPISLRPEAAT